MLLYHAIISVVFSIRSVVFSTMLMLAITTQATELSQANSIPEPLTLRYALSRVNQSHPALRQVEASIHSAEADKDLANSRDGFQSRFIARVRYFESSGSLQNQSNDDHRLGLVVEKNLYDFGRSGALVNDANSRIESERLKYQEFIYQQRIKIMRSYFDVLLADVEFYRYNEEMAVSYISYDKLNNRFELGQVSELDVIEAQSKYRKIRKLRAQKQGLQRITRSRLAYMIGHAGNLPATVSQPGKMPHLQRQLPNVETLQQKAIDANMTLRSLRAEAMAAKNRIEAASAERMPLIVGSAEANAYSQVRARNDTWRVNLFLTVPITTGGRIDAATAKERAELYRISAELADYEELIKQQVLELRLSLESLKLQLEELNSQSDFRELTLDRSRALYEMEVKTDLGNAMVNVTETEHEVLTTEFSIVLAWEQLDAITGVLPLGLPK